MLLRNIDIGKKISFVKEPFCIEVTINNNNANILVYTIFQLVEKVYKYFDIYYSIFNTSEKRILKYIMHIAVKIHNTDIKKNSAYQETTNHSLSVDMPIFLKRLCLFIAYILLSA